MGNFSLWGKFKDDWMAVHGGRLIFAGIYAALLAVQVEGQVVGDFSLRFSSYEHGLLEPSGACAALY